MATKSAPSRSRQHRTATVQWIAISVAIALAVLAAFVFFGSDGRTGGHSGLPALEEAAASF
ncbi:MAG: hypothetical protein OEV40_10620 [Acidimicrobiia bacterium]|nr:hypothetical protein [Acidimicrobiia bacterium]